MSNVVNSADSTAALVRHKLQVQFDLHECHFTPEALSDLADELDPIARQVGDFPVADARVLIEWNGRTSEFSARLTLLLPNEVLVTSCREASARRAIHRAATGLEHAVRRLKEQLDREPDRRRG